MQAQVGALEVQIVIAGLTSSRSSSVPARTKIRCGRDSASLNIGVPHDEQKRRCITLPLSARLRKSVSAPSIAMALLGKQTLTVAFPAAKYWQSRHQQMRVAMGAAVMRKRTALHLHPPVMLSVLSVRLMASSSPFMSFPPNNGEYHRIGKVSQRAPNLKTASRPAAIRELY